MRNKILVVEDEQILAQNLGAYLEAQSMEVQIAFDGGSAIRVARSFAAAVVVLDYRLPDMEGFEVLAAIRKERDCRFVLMTGHPTSEVCERAAQLGIGHILFKPFPLVELAGVINRLLGRRSDTGPEEGAVRAEEFVERRKATAESFPLRLYDGSWVLTDRRRSEPESEGDEGDRRPNGEKGHNYNK
ncbi:Transcriptional regulatory protein SrrA [compost metagenome]|uniref:Response regulator receiver domain-containing protein n=1 Tax=Pseudomonas jinjuensis TaxID=198616 RepID=A0A1G9Z6T7_9PSED|nr:response regulator [Pseudomonas jinjuensis]SDN16471.1 Response regulator receiver domain-containing protein [Pseudomonas jinjuensis]